MADTVIEVPLTSEPQDFSIQLGSITYNINLYWNDASTGGWTIDISDSGDVPIVQGIPLVTGADLLAQYSYLGFQGRLVVYTDSDPDAVPTFTNLGEQSHLFFATSQ